MAIQQIERKALFTAGGLAACLLVVTLWFNGHLADSRAAARAAVDDAQQCARFVADIRSLRHQPSLAESQELQLQELTQRIETAAKRSRISLDSLVRIWPEPAKRVGDTSYKRKPTQVLFHRVTLPDLVGFLQQLSAQDAGPQVTRIRLTAPRGQEAGDQWSVEVTLTYLIYAPRITKDDRARAVGQF